MADWESAEKVQKNAAGEYRAMIGGEWVPVAKAQKNQAGEYRVMRGEIGAVATPPEKEAPPSWRVAMNAANKGIAALPDALLNTPSNLFNLGKSAFGAGAAALGRPDLAPEITQPPNYAHRAMEGMGFVRPQDEPQTGGQRLLDAAVQGGVATAMGSPASGVRQAVTNAGMGALSGGAANIVGEASGSPELALAASIAAPGVASRVPSAVANRSSAMARRLMASALKPTVKQWRTGQADSAINTMLDEGINATRSGVDKLETRLGGLNDEISNMVQGSNATVDRNRVATALDGTRQRFGNQVSPTSDLSAIQSVADDFMAHPNIQSNDIPVLMAQQLKQGTYRALKGKYGEVGSAATEAQKALARGLKEGVAAAVPSVAPLNARESGLLDALAVAERRTMMDANKNPLGLAAIAPSPAGLAAFLADRSGALKSVGARGLHQVGKIPQLPMDETAYLAMLLNQAQRQEGQR